MKKRISPAVAAVVIVGVIAVAALAWNYFAGGRAPAGVEGDEARLELSLPTAGENELLAPESEPASAPDEARPASSAPTAGESERRPPTSEAAVPEASVAPPEASDAQRKVYHRATGVFNGIQMMFVAVRTDDGKDLKLLPAPSPLLLKSKTIASARQFQQGDRLVVYYTVAGELGTLYAALDEPSEILLVELRAKPVEATIGSYDAETRNLTVNVGRATNTYVVVEPVSAHREGKRATLGVRDTKDQRGYSSGDKVLLVMTADGKQVRMVLDQPTHDTVLQDLKYFPVPPASKIPAQ